VSRPPGRPTETSRGKRSKDAIVQAAIRLLAQRGYRGTSLAAVAAEVEMSQPGLLHHFPSKERLLLAVLEERDREDHQRVAGTLAGDGIRPALEAVVRHNQTARELVRLFTVLVGESVAEGHPAHDYFVDRYQRIREELVAKLRRLQADGEVREDADVEALAPVILAVMDGLQVQWLLDPRIDMALSFEAFTAVLWRQLAAPAG